MRYISLFAGIGGFDYALNKLGHECVWANEWDKYAAQIYNRNFKHTSPQDSNEGLKPDLTGSGRNGRGSCTNGIDTRDLRTVSTDDIPDHDLLVGGFPCQAFSIAGKRRGFEDTRGTLFFDVARILKDKHPSYFILENVKGLLSHDNGFTFKTIISTLTELGYDLQWQVLNSKNFGVPQNRERVFIVGHLRGIPRPQVFPIGSDSQPDIVLPTLTSRYWGGQANGGYIGHKEIRQVNSPTHSNDRVYEDSGISPSLNTMQGGRRQPKIVIPVLTPSRVNKRQNGRRFKENGEPSFTLTGQDIHGVAVYDDYNHRMRTDGNVGSVRPTFNNEALGNGNKLVDGTRIRRLTPLECERLQGFPDGWTEKGIDDKGNEVVISDTQRYKVLGNAVTTNVVYEVASKLDQKPNSKD